MFDLEFILKGVALVVAVGILLTTIDFSYIMAKIAVKNDVKVDNNKVVVPTVPVNVDEGSQFLKTLELWYLLKKQCEDYKLTAASEKLDEVFPLLNDNMEG